MQRKIDMDKIDEYRVIAEFDCDGDCQNQECYTCNEP